MKYWPLNLIIIIIIAIFNITSAFAFDAIVIVLEAPLLKEASLSSSVLQTLRKGEHLYVPSDLGDLSNLPEFISTYDRSGNEAFIPKKYIKIITNDIDEEQMPIAFEGRDPTDYRLEEPIPRSYPFSDYSFLRASVSLMMGNNLKAPYDYNNYYSTQSYSMESGARIAISRKISFDEFDRYYFGLLAIACSVNNRLTFTNNIESSENRSILRIGPVITYDTFKTNQYRMTVGAGFTYNYHRSTISVQGDLSAKDQRIFSGASFSPLANLFFQKIDVLPKTDLIGGADLNLYLPHTEKTSDPQSVPEVWNAKASDQLSTALKIQVSLFLGFQFKY